ncbi:MAG TPA: hypothetical protein VFE09_07645 [Rubrobacteraceae bacterium]|nr:hypothetical protein [Rubrobacteraceae bacterium]
MAKNCLHLEGLRAVPGSKFRCPACKACLDLEGVERWVRAAEKSRDEAYSMVEGNEFAEIMREEWQREVYRRRKVLYELRSVPRVAIARPEMILVSYDATEDAYECRIFYKEPRPAWGEDRISVEATLDAILALRSHPDPNVRLASDKAEELHILRLRLVEQNTLPPLRRVFYQNEF